MLVSDFIFLLFLTALILYWLDSIRSKEVATKHAQQRGHRRQRNADEGTPHKERFRVSISMIPSPWARVNCPLRRASVYFFDFFDSVLKGTAGIPALLYNGAAGLSAHA